MLVDEMEDPDPDYIDPVHLRGLTCFEYVVTILIIISFIVSVTLLSLLNQTHYGWRNLYK